MRTLRARLCAAPKLTLALTLTLALLGSPAPAQAATPPVVGRILTTATTAGGAAVLGDPTAAEVKVTISGTNGYSQRFEHGVVVWNRLGGGWATTPTRPDLQIDKVSNDRDALAAAGLRPGVIYRAGEIHKASTSDKLDLAGILHGGTIIDLRSSGTKDPNLPGVVEFRYPMTSTTNTATFVTKSSDRKSIAATLRAIAAEDGPVLIHCHLGRDRTGWVVAVLQMLGGVDLGTIETEYLRSSGAKASNLDKGIVAMYDHFDGIEGYALDGLGLSQSVVDKLQAKVAG